MMTEHTLMQQLKTATEAEHRLTEVASLAAKIRDGSLQIDEYQDLIVKNFLIHHQLEQSLQLVLEQVQEQRLTQFFRERSHSLAQDLAALGLSDRVTPADIPAFPIQPTVAHLLGTLYVLEGSMLGNQYIAKALRQNDHLKAISAFHFYQKDAETGNRWREFQALTNQSNIMDSNEVITAACSAFQYFRMVFETKLNAVPPRPAH